MVRKWCGSAQFLKSVRVRNRAGHRGEGVDRHRDRFLRFISCIRRLGLLKATEDYPRKFDRHVANRLDSIQALLLVLEFAHNPARASDEVRPGHTSDPVKRAATTLEAISGIP